MTGSKKPSEERELKFRVEGLDGVRARLQEIEAERLGPGAFEDNWVLDRAGELAGAGSVLRLRWDGHGARITFKGPRRQEGPVKVRVEHEFNVEGEGVDQAKSLFEALGYQVVRRYQKVREEWRVGGVEIALDHTPIGDFVEFEGDRAEVLAKRCGLDLKTTELRSYLRLYDDYLKDHPDAPPEMVFPQE
jgi:predicted adenylyl cyclase CyaB